MAEEWVKNAHGEVRAALDGRSEVEMELGALKENHAKMAEQLKEAVRVRDSAEAGLRTPEKKFEDMRKQLHYTKINMATEKQLVTELRKELHNPTTQRGSRGREASCVHPWVQETQGRLTEEFSAVARDYCDIS